MIRHLHTDTLKTLRIIRWHGLSRTTSQASLTDADIVITTYNTLATEYKNRPSILHDISWYRVVLDEGQLKYPRLLCHSSSIPAPCGTAITIFSTAISISPEYLLVMYSTHHTPSGHHFLQGLLRFGRRIKMVPDRNSNPEPA